MSDPSHVHLTAQSLKILAHPVRVRLIWLLRQQGPSTATRLAELIGQSSGVTSYHLRQLAQHGFVVEDPDLGTGRERWWRAVHHRSTLDAPTARTALDETETYMRAIAALYAERVDRWLYELQGLPSEWDGTVDLSDYALRLTPEEGAALRTELHEVLGRYRQDSPDTAAPDGTRKVVVQVQLLPFTDRPGAGTPDTGIGGRETTDRGPR